MIKSMWSGICISEQINTKGWKMNYKRERDLIAEAINAGCRTAAQLALYIRLRARSTPSPGAAR
jgi:hypothetical protein